MSRESVAPPQPSEAWLRAAVEEQDEVQRLFEEEGAAACLFEELQDQTETAACWLIAVNKRGLGAELAPELAFEASEIINLVAQMARLVYEIREFAGAQGLDVEQGLRRVRAALDGTLYDEAQKAAWKAACQKAA